MKPRRFTFAEYYLACRFVIMTLRLRLKFRVRSLNINCHRGSDSQISQRPLKDRWCAAYDCGALWLLNFQDGGEGSRK